MRSLALNPSDNKVAKPCTSNQLNNVRTSSRFLLLENHGWP